MWFRDDLVKPSTWFEQIWSCQQGASLMSPALVAVLGPLPLAVWGEL